MSKTTTIYLVRHGQTESNVQNKYQGHQDSPLTELGLNQARWLAESLQNDTIDVVYSSTSTRAHRTAEIIKGNRDIAINKRDELREMKLGVWEGKDQADIKQAYAEQFECFWKDPEKFRLQGAETFAELSQRAVGTLLHIINDNKRKSILIVTHTVVIKAIMTYLENRPLKTIWDLPYIYPTCLCKIEVVNGKLKSFCMEIQLISKSKRNVFQLGETR